MKHYLILKFREGAFSPDVLDETRDILGRLVGELAGVSRVEVRPNCVDRADNHDLMIEMEFADDGVLQKYLDHPRHREFIAFAGPKVASKITFDCR